MWADNDENRYELNIGAEHLNRNPEEILATLMHEMTHLYCIEQGIKDTSNNFRYHNKHFKEQAELRDLEISYAKGIGWSRTKAAPKLIENIRNWGLDYQIQDHRLLYGDMSGYGGKGTGDDDNHGSGGTDDVEGKAVKKKSSTRKYVCPACGISVRATKDVYILCGDCQETMEKEE